MFGKILVFSEGNTRTTAVFFVKDLRTLGYDVTNDVFDKNSWYFRNALVRANYNNISKRIYKTTEYLEGFIRSLILNENYEFKNRTLHIKWNEKQDIGEGKQDIRDESSFKDYVMMFDFSLMNLRIFPLFAIIKTYEEV